MLPAQSELSVNGFICRTRQIALSSRFPSTRERGWLGGCEPSSAPCLLACCIQGAGMTWLIRPKYWGFFSIWDFPQEVVFLPQCVFQFLEFLIILLLVDNYTISINSSQERMLTAQGKLCVILVRSFEWKARGGRSQKSLPDWFTLRCKGWNPSL